MYSASWSVLGRGAGHPQHGPVPSVKDQSVCGDGGEVRARSSPPLSRDSLSASFVSGSSRHGGFSGD